jgi:hypothetical protein
MGRCGGRLQGKGIWDFIMSSGHFRLNHHAQGDGYFVRR